MQLETLKTWSQPNQKLSFGEGGLMLTATNIWDQFENTSASILKSQREAIEFWKEAVSIVCSIAVSAKKKVMMRVRDARPPGDGIQNPAGGPKHLLAKKDTIWVQDVWRSEKAKWAVRAAGCAENRPLQEQLWMMIGLLRQEILKTCLSHRISCACQQNHNFNGSKPTSAGAPSGAAETPLGSLISRWIPYRYAPHPLMSRLLSHWMAYSGFNKPLNFFKKMNPSSF